MHRLITSAALLYFFTLVSGCSEHKSIISPGQDGTSSIIEDSTATLLVRCQQRGTRTVIYTVSEDGDEYSVFIDDTELVVPYNIKVPIGEYYIEYRLDGYFPGYSRVYANEGHNVIAFADLRQLPKSRLILERIYLNSAWTGNYQGHAQIVVGYVDLESPVDSVTADLGYSPSGKSGQSNEDVEWLAVSASGDTVSLGPLRDPGIGGHQVRRILPRLSAGRWFIYGIYAGDPSDPGANSVHHFVITFWGARD